MSTRTLARRVVDALSNAPECEHVLAYGSAVLRAASVTNTKSALDILCVVENVQEWHETNVHRNPSHYASQMRVIGSQGIVKVSRVVGCGTHYNARLFDARGEPFKYGVASVEDVVRDLERWEYLFVAGRMQKPHETMLTSAAVRDAQRVNVRNAANAALLTLPESFSELDFHRALVRLSYDGDVRFLFAAEDDKKVERIASANGDAMRDMYADTVTELGDALDASSSTWWQDKSPSALRARLEALPVTVRAMMSAATRVRVGEGVESSKRWAADVCAALSDDQERVGSTTRACLRQIVRTSSLRQAVAGLLGTSPTKTVAYVGAKFYKSARSRFFSE